MTVRLRHALSLSLFATLGVAARAGPASPPRPPAFAICGACHATAANAPAGVGPNLWNVGGRKAGAGVFAYSEAMRSAQIRWDRATLIAYIRGPQKIVPGNKMAYAGQSNPETAAAIADYVLSLGPARSVPRPGDP